MMRQMRENTKWIMLITAIAFVALMVFEWGMDLTGRSGAQAAGGELGRVNGEIITYEEFLAVYRNLYQQQQLEMDGPIGSSINRQIEDAAWEQLVTQRLLQQEMRRRGIRVTTEEIRQAALYAPPPELQAQPAFQTDGQFDPAKYQAFLASPALDEQFLRQLEGYYRDIIPRSKLFFQNTAGLHISEAQLWRMWRDANETATVSYIAFLPDVLIPDSEVNITEQAIREHYNRNRDNYLRPAQASVRYVSMSRVPTAADTTAARQQAAEHRAAVLGGESFTAVAQRASDDMIPGRFSGEEFTVVRNQSAPALDEAYFNTPVGQVSEPILGGAGFHVVRVESRSDETAQVRQIVVPIRMSEQAENSLLDRADSLERAAERAGLDQAAAQMGLQVRTAELTPALPILPGVGAADDGVDWAFNEGAVGEVSPVLETPEAFYVMELVSRRDEGPLSLQEATPTIRAYLTLQAKLQRARTALADAERRARAGESLEQIASGYRGSTVEQAGPFTRGDFVPGLGRMNAAIGAAFGLRPGETSPLVEANTQLYIVRTLAREDADPAAWRAQLDGQRARVMQAMGDARWNQFMMGLRDNADIVDNRNQVLRQPATAANGR
jgi:peptidyl-prolyl cis-trans isomerase D